MRACVVIPAYNAARSVAEVVRRSLAECSAVVVVDDGSTDGTAARAESAGAVVLHHPKNLGKGSALKTAFAWAWSEGYSHLVTLDADGQHFPEDISLLVAALRERPNALVLGQRSFADLPLTNRFGNRFSNRWVNWAARSTLADTQCGLRIYPADLTQRFELRASGFAFETEALIQHLRARSPFATVPVRVSYPQASERVSHFHPWRDATRIVFTVMRFLFLPRWFC